MNTKKLLTLLLLAAALGTAAVQAQTLRCWRIVTGPGRGIALTGSGGYNVDDHYWGALGFVAPGHYTDCQCTSFDGHYHGQLFGAGDPDGDHCGWGCVVEIPCSPAMAADALQNLIDDIWEFENPYLGDKLQRIFDKMEDAAEFGCTSVFDGLAGAFAEEIRSYFLASNNLSEFNGVNRGLVEFVNSTLDTLAYSNPPPVVPDFSVQILRRLGTGLNSRLFDPGAKINVPVGQPFTLEAYGAWTLMSPGFRWDPRWKGMGEGETPDGAAVAYRNNRITVMSQRPTSLKLGVQLRYDEKKIARDAITLNFTQY